MQIHAAMVNRMDQNIGRLVAKLRGTGQLENTLIFFLVDNGSSHERPGRGEKNAKPRGERGFLKRLVDLGPMRLTVLLENGRQGLEGGICTPMIAHWPDGIKLPPNSICREPCHLVDFVPTFMQLAGDGARYPKHLPPRMA